MRQHAFRYRYETEHEPKLLNELRALVVNRKNFLVPCVEATGWTHTASGRKKRVHDKPITPYQRLPKAEVLDDAARERLPTEHAELNPAAITRHIHCTQQQLIDLADARTQGTRPAA